MLAHYLNDTKSFVITRVNNDYLLYKHNCKTFINVSHAALDISYGISEPLNLPK